MKAASTSTSPVTRDRARPPWLRTMMSHFSSPLLTIWAMRPLTPVSMRVMTPLRM